MDDVRGDFLGPPHGISKQFSNQIFMNKYCLSCLDTHYYLYFILHINFTSFTDV